jgi:uncharacterized delta-60 repeat protein
MKPSRVRVFVSYFAASVVLLSVAIVAAPAARAQDVQVTSAIPSVAEQGTVNLNVTIKGKGFKAGAQAQWFVTGTTNPGGVTVNSTAFVSGSELLANITIADTADIANFDIQVVNTNGRSGKGTELFSVVAKGSLNGGSVDACTSRAWVAPSHAPAPNYCPASGAGCLDPAFGTGGIVYPGVAGNLATTGVAAFQANPATGTPRMLVGGMDDQYQAVVARFELDGQMDPTFGTSGVAVISPPTTSVSDEVRAIAVQADGKILVIWSLDIFRVTRLNADGTLDSSFGTNGHAVISSIGRCVRPTSNALAVQADGKIAVAGRADCGWIVARLNSTGSPDSSFGNGGTVVYAPRTSKGTGVLTSAVAIQNVAGEERILVAGTSSLNKTGADFGLARFRANGTLDTSFGPGGAGIVNTDFFRFDERPWGMQLDWAGRPVVVGTTQNDSCGAAIQSAVARYTPNGLPDVTFGDFDPSTGQRTGRTAVNITTDTEGMDDVAFQPDGSLVAVGKVKTPNGSTHYACTAVRWTPDGVLDPVFGDRGVAMIDPSPNPYTNCRDLLLAPDGRITLFGATSSDPVYFRGIWTFLGLRP